MRQRGEGRIWQIGRIWWIQYYVRGQQRAGELAFR